MSNKASILKINIYVNIEISKLDILFTPEMKLFKDIVMI